MATNKTLELRDVSDSDLQDQLNDSSSSYEKMKFDHTRNDIEDPLQLRKIRRDVARIKTEIRRRELEAMPAEAHAKRDNIRRRRKK